MRLDRVCYAAEPDGLLPTARRLGAAIGVQPVEGRVHPRLGSRTMVLPLAGSHCVEVVEALEHPATLRMPFGQAVRTRTRGGGGWLTWVVAVDDAIIVERRLGPAAAPVHRRSSDGTLTCWRQVGAAGPDVDPQLPFLTSPRRDPGLRELRVCSPVRLSAVRISGSPRRVTSWLGGPGEGLLLDDVDVEWVAPHGTPGLLEVCFETPTGTVVR